MIIMQLHKSFIIISVFHTAKLWFFNWQLRVYYLLKDPSKFLF